LQEARTSAWAAAENTLDVAAIHAHSARPLPGIPAGHLVSAAGRELHVAAAAAASAAGIADTADLSADPRSLGAHSDMPAVFVAVLEVEGGLDLADFAPALARTHSDCTLELLPAEGEPWHFGRAGHGDSGDSGEAPTARLGS
jgi:hypothetical protein